MEKLINIIDRAIGYYHSGKYEWFQGYAAADKDGLVTNIDSPDTCKLCMYGVLRRAAWDEGYNVEESLNIGDIFQTIFEKNFKMTLGAYNDRHIDSVDGAITGLKGLRARVVNLRKFKISDTEFFYSV